MVKHTQTICRQIVDELFEYVWPFCGVGSSRATKLRLAYHLPLPDLPAFGWPGSLSLSIVTIVTILSVSTASNGETNSLNASAAAQRESKELADDFVEDTYIKFLQFSISSKSMNHMRKRNKEQNYKKQCDNFFFRNSLFKKRISAHRPSPLLPI